MTLLNDFFIINSITSDEGSAKATLELNAMHEIFEGHFPWQPVVPGVCMMQMIKEILEISIGKETRLKKADHLKFLSVINPAMNNIANADLKYSIEATGEINLTATLSNSTATCFKFRGMFIPA